MTINKENVNKSCVFCTCIGTCVSVQTIIAILTQMFETQVHLVSFSNKFIMAVLNQKLANVVESFLQHVSFLH